MKWDRESSAALISAGTSALLVCLQLALSAISGSLALMADAFHSASDVFVSTMVFIGLRVSRKETISPSFRIKIEGIVALVVSLFIWFAAYVIFKEAIGRKTTDIKMLPIAISGSFVSVLITYFLSHYKTHVGHATNSPSLLADGAHSRTDMFSSIAVLLGLTGYTIGLKLDTIVAVILGAVIILVGVGIFRSAVKALWTKSAFEIHTFRLDSVPLSAVGKLGKYRRPFQWVAIACLVFAYFSTGLYIVGAAEEGVVQRFGKIVEHGIRPGIHYRFPWPFETLKKIQTKEIKRLEIGFRTRDTFKGEPSAYLWETLHKQGRYEKHYEEALMLTGDQNIVDVNTVIHYRITNPVDYLFNNDDPQSMMKGAAEMAIRYVVAKQEIETILTVKRQPMEEEIRNLLQGFSHKHALGMEVTRVDISEIHPPIEIVPAFRSVADARQHKERSIREAESYSNEIVPIARAEAAKVVSEARAYKAVKINRAEGEAERFLKKLDQYSETKNITMDRIYLETMEKVLPRMNKFILRPRESKDILDLRTYTLTKGAKGAEKK